MNQRAFNKRALLLVAIIVAGTIGGSNPAAAATRSQGAQSPAVISLPAGGYDGKALYVGLAFGQGPVGALFPELGELRTLMATEQETTNALVAEISRTDSSFFDRFASEIQSGDRVRIRAALSEADNLGTGAASRIVVFERQGRMVADQDLVLFVAAALLVVVVLLVFAFAAPVQAQVAPLDRDITADRIARVLRPAG